MRLHPASRVAQFVEAGWWHADPAWTWDGLLRARVAERPGAVAVVDPPDRPALLGTPGRRLTWARLDTEVHRFAALLAARGVRPDAVVGTQLPNTVEQVVAVLACARLGAIVAPFPMAYRSAELAQLGGIAGLAALVTVGALGGRHHAAEAREAADRLGNDVAVLAWPTPRENLPAGVEDAGGTAVEGSVVPSRPGHPADVVTLSWTSGTEAAPKGVPRCANTWTTIGRGCAAAAHLTGDDVLLGAFPAADAIGIGGVLVPWLLTGARLVLHHPSEPTTFLHQVAAERVTAAVAPPALLNALQPTPEQFDVSSLRVIGTGAAPLSGTMVGAWTRRGVEVVNVFGSHEGVALVGDRVSVPDPEARAGAFPWFGGRGLTWTNPASAGVRSRLVDPRSGADITEPGRTGELRITGPAIFAGYWGGGGDPFDEHGWFRTGDAFVIDERDPRLLRHVDRVGDLIVRRGGTVSPAELEGLIGTHPGVADVAVVGVPDGRPADRVAAVVVPAGDIAPPTLDDLVAHLLDQRVAAHKLPERLRVVDALPRNALGKVLKRRLRRQLSGV